MLRPVGIRKIGLKYLFKVKENPDGTVERYKARCVALGNLQREGFDYDETFAPVTRYSSTRVLCAISAKKGHVIHQMDVDTAFLYGVMPDDNHYLWLVVRDPYMVLNNHLGFGTRIFTNR